MANLISRATGVFTADTTWQTEEAGASATQTTISSSTNTTTSYVYSSAFTVTNADVIEGVLLHCKRVNTTGTVSVGISADNGVTNAATVVVNASDLPVNASWVFFEFSSTVTGDGGSDYKIGITGSSAGNATFYRDGTVGNWGRILPKQGNVAPAATNGLFVVGELTGAGTSNSFTVTMDEAAAGATVYGQVDISYKGSLVYGSSASTNYYLKIAGDMNVWDTGTFDTTLLAAVTTSTGVLEFNCGSNVQYGLVGKGGEIVTLQGKSMTYDRAKLNADAAANATSLTTDVSTGWADNSEIAVASSTRTYSECEWNQLSGAASGTTISVDQGGGTSGGVLYAHSGTNDANGDIRAEVIHLTRSFRIQGASASLQAYIVTSATGTWDADWTEFKWMGSNTSLKYGISIATTSGSASFNRCSLRNFQVSGSRAFFPTGANHDNISLTNNVLWSIDSYFLDTNIATTGTTLAYTGNLGIYTIGASNGDGYYAGESSWTIQNNSFVGCKRYGINFEEEFLSGVSFSSNTIHSCGSAGVYLAKSLIDFSFSDMIIWRCIGAIAGSANIAYGTFSNLISFGHTNEHVFLGGGGGLITFTGANLQAGATLATPKAINYSTLPYTPAIIFEDSSIGTVTEHSSGDIYLTTANKETCNIILRNTTLGSTNKIVNQSYMTPISYITAQKYGGSSGANYTWTRYGTQSLDAVIYDVSPSLKMQPNNASSKLKSGLFQRRFEVPVASGQTVTISAKVRMSLAGDAGGADYNGNLPNLYVEKNVCAGITSDTILDTSTAAYQPGGASQGLLETLSGTTAAVTENCVLSFYVDCDGTAGWINVDTIVVA